MASIPFLPKLKTFTFFLLLGAIFAPRQAAAASAVIAQVRSTAGQVTARGADGLVSALKVGDPTYLGDSVETATGGKVGLVLIDGTAVALGERTELRVGELLYSPGVMGGTATESVGLAIGPPASRQVKGAD